MREVVQRDPEHQAERDAARDDYVRGMKIADVAEKYGRALRTIERWQAQDGWRKQKAIVKLENLQTSRQRSDETLSEAMPKLMSEAIALALHAESESTKATMLKYLLGTLGYSPEASEHWLKSMELKLSQLSEQQEKHATVSESKDYSDVFANAIDMGAIVGGYPPNSENGEAEPEVLPPEGDEIWEE